jgi:DNA-binding IclR family transcriptional regulator
MRRAIGTGRSHSTAISKTLAVLEAVAEHQRLADIAEATGLPKSTVHRILQALVEQDFAIAAGDGSYLAGPRILSLAGQVLSGFDFARQLGPALRELQRATGFTIHFALLSGAEAIYVEKLENAGQPYRMASRVGMRLPLHCTAIGKAILASLPESDAERLLAEAGLERRTPNTITKLPDMRRELELVRARGFSIDDEENEESTRCVGAPVFDHQGRVLGGISVSTLTFLLSHDDAERLGPQVTEAARSMSLVLGARLDASPAGAA